MNIAVCYYTKTGNTEKIAKAAAQAVGVSAEKTSVALQERADVLFLGSSVYAAGVSEEIKTFIAENAQKIGLLVNLSTAALLPSTYKQVQKIAKRCGVTVAKEEFHCRGSFYGLHANRPNADDLRAAENFAKAVVEKYGNK